MMFSDMLQTVRSRPMYKTYVKQG